jgi:cation:H+ antiporter
MSSVLLLAFSFAIVLSGAVLFTNAVEWLGYLLKLGQGAVGSVLAAVATAMPESLIPVVAVIGGAEDASDVATGAILGAPFLLATLTMALVAGSAYLWRQRRPQGLGLAAHFPTLRRDLGFFLLAFSGSLLLGVAGAPRELRIAAAVALVLAYLGYLRLTLVHSGEAIDEEQLKPLVFDPLPGDPPSLAATVVQLVVALGSIVGGAHLFVEELLDVAELAGVEPLLLSLVLAPFATELPEKLNSVIWVREGKDTLALGNITGAMVFQSTLPVAFALAFTPWQLDNYAVLSGTLALAGGLLVIVAFQIRRRFSAAAAVLWVMLYATFVAYVVGTA